MHPMEYAQLLAALHALGARRCLEWGSGGSTVALLRDCAFIERYVSIEHDRAWHDKVRAIATDPRLSLCCVEPDVPFLGPQVLGRENEQAVVAYNARAEREPAIMASYVALPEAHRAGPYDFVLVDGRARRFCVTRGYGLLRDGGALVIHDAQRSQYHDAIEATGGDVRFLDPWEQGQICIIRKR
jgi:predicted O-methyltransferase YrrM